MYSWPLNVSNFSFLDRLKLCYFFLNPRQFWTAGDHVTDFEKKMAKKLDFKYALFCSSGSTANHILAMYVRDKMTKERSKRNIVVLPSTTWSTSCSPWIREGFTPYFIDVSIINLGMDLNRLDVYLRENHEKIACVFPTALLGFNINYEILSKLRIKYPKILFYIDQCENTFGKFEDFTSIDYNRFTCTTSTYFGHQLQSVEGGFIFTNKDEEYSKFLMYRNHGMTRSLNGNQFANFQPVLSAVSNVNVDPRFDFFSLGDNFRNSNIHAFIGLLDFNRIDKYVEIRRKLFDIFRSSLNTDSYIFPRNVNAAPFCLPIIIENGTSKRIAAIKVECAKLEIETRPIISGFLGYQTAFRPYFSKCDLECPDTQYPNSNYLHKYGIYVGLHTKLKEKDILRLTALLNQI